MLSEISKAEFAFDTSPIRPPELLFFSTGAVFGAAEVLTVSFAEVTLSSIAAEEFAELSLDWILPHANNYGYYWRSCLCYDENFTTSRNGQFVPFNVPKVLHYYDS